jgi:hypothetical protein
MSLPGTSITVRETPPSRTPPTDTGVWFIAGLADQGELKPTLVTGIADFVTKFGDRQTYSMLYDALDAFFAEGGSRAYVSRVVGPAAVQASFMLLDSVPAATLQVRAISPGAWGNALNVAVLAGDAGGEFKLQVSHDTLGILETSPSLVDKTAAIAWAVGSSTSCSSTRRASTTRRWSRRRASWAAPTIARTSPTRSGRPRSTASSRDLGPGQVSLAGPHDRHGAPGAPRARRPRNRSRSSTCRTPRPSRRSPRAPPRRAANGRYGGAFAPWAVVPGVPATGGTPHRPVLGDRRRDPRPQRRGRSPNVAAAGEAWGRRSTRPGSPSRVDGRGRPGDAQRRRRQRRARQVRRRPHLRVDRSLADPASRPELGAVHERAARDGDRRRGRRDRRKLRLRAARRGRAHDQRLPERARRDAAPLLPRAQPLRRHPRATLSASTSARTSTRHGRSPPASCTR